MDAEMIFWVVSAVVGLIGWRVAVKMADRKYLSNEWMEGGR